MDQIEFEESKFKPSESVQIVIENLWTAIRGFVEKYKKQVDQNNLLKQENTKLNTLVSELNEKVEKLELDIKTIEAKCSPEEIQRYENIIAQLEEENNSLQLYYEEYQKQKKFLEGSLFGYSDFEDKYRELEGSYKLAKEDIVQKNILINQLNEEILNHKETIAELENKLFQMQEKEKKLLILESKVIELQKYNHELQEQTKQYKNELINLRNQSKELTLLKDQLEKLQKEQSELEKNLEKTVMQKIEKEREVEKLTNEILQIKTKFDELKQKELDFLGSIEQILADQPFSSFKITLTDKTFSGSIAPIKQIAMKLNELLNEANSLRDENEQLKNIINDIKSESAKKIKELEEEIAIHKSRIAGLENELTAKEKERYNLDLLFNELKIQEEGKSAQVSLLEEENEELKVEILKLKEEINIKQKKFDELFEQIEINRTTIEDLTTQIENLNSDLLDLKSKKLEIELELKRMQTEINVKEEQIRELTQFKNEFYRLHGESNTLKQINKEMKELNKLISDEKIELQKKIFSLNKERNELQDNYLKALREKEKIEILYNEKIMEFRNVNEELTKLQLAMKEKEKTKGILIEQITALINQIDNLIEAEN